MIKEGDKTFFTIPGKKNVIQATDPKLGELVDELGIKIDVPDLAEGLKDQSVKLTKYKFNQDGYEIIVNRNLKDKAKDSIVAIAADGKKYRTKDLVDATDDGLKNLYNGIKSSMDKFNAGDDLARLNTISYASGNVDDVFKVFTVDSVGGSEGAKLKTVITNRFGKNAPALDAYRRAYPDVDNAIKNMNFKEDWKVVEGFYDASTHCGNGKFKIVNNNVVGVTINGKYYPEKSDMFQSVLYRNPKIRENILEHSKDFYNVTYHIA